MAIKPKLMTDPPPTRPRASADTTERASRPKAAVPLNGPPIYKKPAPAKAKTTSYKVKARSTADGSERKAAAAKSKAGGRSYTYSSKGGRRSADASRAIGDKRVQPSSPRQANSARSKPIQKKQAAPGSIMSPSINDMMARQKLPLAGRGNVANRNRPMGRPATAGTPTPSSAYDSRYQRMPNYGRSPQQMRRPMLPRTY